MRKQKRESTNDQWEITQLTPINDVKQISPSHVIIELLVLQFSN